MEHHQLGALQPQRRDHGEQEGPCPRRGTGKKMQANTLLLMVILLSACRADGPILCLALLVSYILYLLDHLRALITSSPQPQALVLLFALIDAVQLAVSDTVESANFHPLLRFSILVHVMRFCWLNLLKICRYLPTSAKVRGRAPDVEGQFDRLS